MTYRSAVTVWSIFFVIFVFIAIGMGYLFKKNRIVLQQESANLLKLEKHVQEKRGQLTEHNLLLSKSGGDNKKSSPNGRSSTGEDFMIANGV